VDDLANYIDQARHRGYNDDEIRESLVSGGWDAGQVDAKLGELPPPNLPNHISSSPSLPVTNAPYLQAENYAAATEQAQAEAQAQQAPPPVVSVTTPMMQPVVGQPAPVQTGLETQVGMQPALAQPAALDAAPHERHLNLRVLLVLAVVVLTAFLSYKLFAPKTSYQTIVDKFIVAVQNGDRATVDALESPASKKFYQKTTGDSGFYASCQDAGELCTSSFSKSYLAKAKKTLKAYTAENGSHGKQIVYTVTQKSNSPECQGTSTGVISIAVVPKGRTWQVDNVGLNFSYSGGACPTSST